ncbi:mevalonate kinase [Talaromyces proteolyticus]|uniref:Mevalonate kinase n=1 Tax=Talaromyces proteolyticus TaxID=1131652 RepID=A0AAD4KQ58_9EURO|nr:mevalonate kinase [Talaromyces proteolyticus]KAH8693674.1 mevalonate kinase [Talaromyces proteolyticus]
MQNGNSRKKNGNGSVRASNKNNKNRVTVSELQARFKTDEIITTTSNNDEDNNTDNSDGSILTPSTSSPTANTNSSKTTVKMASHTKSAQHARKISSPMAPPFMVSAPGKVIVFGEHAVVHGKAALAAAISLRSYLLVTTLSKSHRNVTLNFRDIGLDHTWDIDSLPWNVFQHPSKKKMYYDLVTELDPELLEAMQPHVAAVSANETDDVRKIHQNSAAAFLYLFLSLGSPNSHAAIYTLRSTIPPGAGLGSSGSVSVCISAALLLQIRTLAGPHPDQPPDEAAVQIERINRWAFVGEMCIHGNPSGVDNTVSSGGKAVLFRRDDYSKPPTVTFLNNFPELPLLIVNTNQSRSTAVEVAKVGTLLKTHPQVTAAMLDTIDQVTISAHNMITSSDFDNDDEDDEDTNTETLSKFGALFRINHGLLVSLGVSHPRLERIRELVDYSNIGWTKLTGGGGGGCAITLLRADASPQARRQLDRSLAAENFSSFETTLGGDGVGVLYPAVLRNGSDEEGGEEIDQLKFENAVGNDGIERLVGVGGGVQEKREGWKFWRRAG